MNTIQITSCALLGVDAVEVTVEVDITCGLPGYHVVGLPMVSVKESAVRVRSAIERVGHKLPSKMVTVYLTSASRLRSGAAFDLPIAVGILAANELTPLGMLGTLDGLLLFGELGLGGELRSVPGALAAAMLARQNGYRGVLMPTMSAAEAAAVNGIEVYEAAHLSEVVAAMSGIAPLRRARIGPFVTIASDSQYTDDMRDISGLAAARTALEISAAGGHNLLLVGPPGCGKSMLARRLPSILPPISHTESLETTKVYSAVGLNRAALVTQRPFRAPHHSSSAAALLGGGIHLRPGEVSLAHHGVLFLDELPEFQRVALESLCPPLETRVVTVSRDDDTVSLPASFLLVGAANPCPCGWFGSAQHVCACSPQQIEQYRSRLRGPLFDRIDLHIDLADDPDLRWGSVESSAEIRARVVSARDRQRTRLADFGCQTNAEMTGHLIRATCRMTRSAERALNRLCETSHGMTARSVTQIVKVARTIADLRDQDDIDRECVIEASRYRPLSSKPPSQK